MLHNLGIFILVIFNLKYSSSFRLFSSESSDVPFSTSGSDTFDVTETDEVTPATSPEEVSDSEDFVFTGCGKSGFSHELSDRIMGGEDAEQEHWPWHVQLSRGQFYTSEHKSDVKMNDFCGASLINKNWALTAGHCVFHYKPTDQTEGQIFLTFGDRKNPTATVVRSVKQAYVHPYFEYKLSQAKFDIGLILLNESIQFTSTILPICLPEVDLDLTGHSVYLTGRGLTSNGTEFLPAETLQQAKMQILHSSECFELISAELCPSWPGCNLLRTTTDSMFCAGLPDGSVSGAHGDSGGPLVLIQYDGTWTQVGIVSTGHPEYKFGMYTKVAKNLWWINKIIEANSPPEKFDDGGY